MKKTDSIWTKTDKFLSGMRRITLNVFTVAFLIFTTVGILATFTGTLVNLGSGDEDINTDGKVLWFKPTGVVVDTAVIGSPTLDTLLLGDPSVEQHELQDLLKVLENAAQDDSLAAIYVNVSELGMYYSTAFEIANAVKNIKDNGKKVIAYAEGYGNAAYLISSQANTVLINEYGTVGAFGFSRKREFYKDLFEKINLNYHIFTAGDFKSGPEPYTRNSMSDQDKLAWNEFANPLWEKMTDMMESGRNIPEGSIQSYGDSFYELSLTNPEPAKIALDLGLVDQIVTREELRHWMFKEFPNSDNNQNKLPDSISIYEYLDNLEEPFNFSESKNNIAIINVEGVIVTGEAVYGVAGSDTIVNNIQKAIEDDSVKALVLRVNSPGGDVWASELITNALNEFKSTGRPIVSSMGDIAASGGVWVTTLSDEIWAKPETITGSIGVYGIVPTLDGIYDWAGIQVDGVSSTKAGEWDPRLPMPEYITNSTQASIDNIYEKFVTKVAENREMPYKETLAVAGGRIWSGEKALQLGLVDQIGGINDAIESAANIANISDYEIIKYSKELDPFEVFLTEFLNELDSKFIQNTYSAELVKLLNSQYRFIDLEKQINTAVYCFECDYLIAK
ncbi:MAG: signal peptide peptidase SppA [Gammaproteobacteria bacterium]|nr:signal peptide peptidase SppA [Gammaproteobacteria bacterium]